MKTNVIMESTDRVLFDIKIRQQTKTSMLNISDLERVANKRNAIKGYSIKHIPEVLSRRDNVDRIYYILNKQGGITVDISTFIEQVNNKGIITTLKLYNAWKTTGARHTKTSWANPYIWSLVALEMSPEIYGETVVWLTDKLIINRIEAGNFYKELTKAVSKFENVDYIKLAKALNFIVFNKHEPGIRNTATQEQLKKLEELEKHIAFVINNGLVHTFGQVVLFLRKIYNNTYSLKQIIC